MNMLKIMPFKVFYGANSEIVHFNTTTLALSEVEQGHIDMLNNFSAPSTTTEVLAKYQDKAITKAYLDDLIELGMLVDADTSCDNCRICRNNSLPTSYRIALTEQCNLACDECFVTKNRMNLATMSDETMTSVITNSINGANGQELTYHFFGGEPLIRFDLIKKAVSLLNSAVSDGLITKPTYAITTNGTLVTDEVTNFFVNNNFNVGVSIDGDRATHNALRPYINGKDSYDDVVSTYRSMATAGVNIHPLITPNPSHLDKLVDIAKSIMDEFPMHNITINTPFKYDTLEWSVPGDRYAEVLFKIIRIAKERNIIVDSAASSVIASIANGTRRSSACSITGETFMASVSPSGDLSYCAQKWHKRLSLDQKPTIDLGSRCLNCFALGFCGGVCLAFSMLSGVKHDKNKCDFMHAFLPLMIKNLDLFEEQEVNPDDNG